MATQLNSPQSPQSPRIETSTTEQTGIHFNTFYLHTVPGTIKAVCLVRIIQINYFLGFSQS